MEVGAYDLTIDQPDVGNNDFVISKIYMSNYSFYYECQVSLRSQYVGLITV
jgi:hypothetical protein